MIFAFLAVEISENAKASAFPAACCRVLQSIGAVDLDPFAGHGGMKSPCFRNPGPVFFEIAVLENKALIISADRV
jgi:hypothetical protein